MTNLTPTEHQEQKAFGILLNGRTKNLSGMKFERLQALYPIRKDKNNRIIWHCLCDCGKTIEVVGKNLLNKNTKSCGCYKIDKQKEMLDKRKSTRITREDNGKRPRIYRIYRQMKNRCYNKNKDNYSSYGGSGIVICDEWLNSFACFRKWAFANGYEDYLSLDRIDNNKNYSPDNCRWATSYVQTRNRKNTVFIGSETVSEYAKRNNISYGKAYKIAKGKDNEKVNTY